MQQTQEEWDATIDARNTLISNIKATATQLDNEEIGDADDDENHHQALSITEVTVKTILLTCGGPSIGIDLHFNDLNEVTKGEYWSTAHTGGNLVTCELHEDDLETIMRVYGLEY